METPILTMSSMWNIIHQRKSYRGYALCIYSEMETVKWLIDNKVNLYLQKEKMTLLDDNSKPSIFAPMSVAFIPAENEDEQGQHNG